jgi:oligopeptide/dipeptide ABC transporter ATP-binding protein
MTEPVLIVSDLVKHYHLKGSIFGRPRIVHALDGVSFTLSEGQTLAVVGESGCGKSTLARCLLHLTDSTSGTIRLAGEDVTHPSREQRRTIARSLQIVFQDPYASLNPRSTTYQTISDPLRLHGRHQRAERRGIATKLLERVGLGPEFMDRHPHELSGGQRQRVAIARALAVRPKVVVCDEPVSALDVSVQAQVVDLLKRLQSELGMSYLFISHDLGFVQRVSDAIAVMYLGQIVEFAATSVLRRRIKHPYSQALFSATPIPDPIRARDRQRIVLSGDVPSPINPPSGCRFHTRCPYRQEICVTQMPALRSLEDRLVRCHFADQEGFPPDPRREKHPGAPK